MASVVDIPKDSPVHFIGIGGIGMSGIAFTFLHRGYKVTGSDLKGSSITARLKEAGAEIFEGHRASNVPRKGTVVYSSAVQNDNPEMLEAVALGLPVLMRAKALAWLMRDRVPIAIAGTHGKTTTTTLVTLMLHHARYDPSAVIGGIVDAFGGNVLCGNGPHIVAEADESDGSFVNFYPTFSIVTNVEEEHLGFYNNLQEILDAFARFIENTLLDGRLVYNLDEPNIAGLARGLNGRTFSYSISQPADIFAENISLHGFGSTFDVIYEGKPLGTMELNIPGIHNVSNSLAALAVAMKLGISFETAKEAVRGFRGVRRRLEVKGHVDDILVLDDYAHHPTEVSATLRSARIIANGGRLLGVFQPHRYSRTKYLHKKFSGAFSSADRLILTDVYAANEPAIEGIDGRTILRSVLEGGQENVEYFPDLHDIPDFLSETVRPGDVVVTMGAGNISIVADELVRRLKERRNQLMALAGNEQ
jgi:UDP-N-acetylmuramate--alanine ligase